MKEISNESFDFLIQIMEGFNVVLTARFKRRMRSFLFETTYKKGSRILNSGETQKLVWLMSQGLVREIRVNRLSFDETTVWFWLDTGFLYTMPGFFGQDPSESTIEVLQDCKVIGINYEDWSLLKEEFAETMEVTEKIRGENDRLRWQHADNILHMNTADHYELKKEYLMKLFGLTKLQYIAEFMGMSADRLGRLRSQF